MNVYARFDEIPSITLKDIKKIKRYGREQDNSPTRQLTDTVFETIHRQILRQLTDTL